MEYQLPPGDFPSIKEMRRKLQTFDFNKIRARKRKYFDLLNQALEQDIGRLFPLLPAVDQEDLAAKDRERQMILNKVRALKGEDWKGNAIAEGPKGQRLVMSHAERESQLALKKKPQRDMQVTKFCPNKSFSQKPATNADSEKLAIQMLKTYCTSLKGQSCPQTVQPHLTQVEKTTDKTVSEYIIKGKPVTIKANNGDTSTSNSAKAFKKNSSFVQKKISIGKTSTDVICMSQSAVTDSDVKGSAYKASTDMALVNDVRKLPKATRLDTGTGSKNEALTKKPIPKAILQQEPARKQRRLKNAPHKVQV